MLRFLFFAGAMAALLYIAVIYASNSLVILAFAGILLMAAAFLYLLLIRFGTRFSLEIPISMVQQEMPAEFEIKIENKSILPVVKLKFQTVCKLSIEKRGKKIWTQGAADAYGNTIVKGKLTPYVSGGYHVYIKKIKIYDLTGIFSITRYPGKEISRLYVMPEPEEYAVTVSEASRHFTGESGDDAELFQIRPFRDGDRLQSIHWKMSAKTDELMIRENHASAGCPVVLFLDFGGKKKGGGNFYALALSLSYSLTAAKCPHYVVWYSVTEQDIMRAKVENEECLYQLLLRLFDEETDGANRDIRMLYCEKYRTDYWITDIFVNQNCNVLINGSLTERIKEVELIV